LTSPRENTPPDADMLILRLKSRSPATTLPNPVFSNSSAAYAARV
jgi:hypothetical protein